MTYFVIFFLVKQMCKIADVLFILVFDGSVLLYFSTFQIIAGFIEKEIWDIIRFRGLYKQIKLG